MFFLKYKINNYYYTTKYIFTNLHQNSFLFIINSKQAKICLIQVTKFKTYSFSGNSEE